MKIVFRAPRDLSHAQLPEGEEELSGRAWGITIAISLLFAVGLFFVLPVTIANFWKDSLGSSVVFVIVEKLIRVGIFLGYLWAISKLPDLQRVFEYHGAEHKVIAAYEAGDRLVPERASLYSRLHMLCGTSFLLIVMIISVVRVRSDRATGPALADPVARAGDRPGRGTRLRGDQVGWAQPAQALGAKPMCPGLQLQTDHARAVARPLAVSIASPRRVLAVEDPSKSSDEDRLGMEVVA